VEAGTPRDPLRGIAPVLLALIGAGAGVSVFFEAFYDVTVWGPIGIGLMAVLLAVVIGAPARLRGPAAVALAGIVVLWLWSWLSKSWAESGEQALLSAARWAVYAAVFALVLMLTRDGRDRRVVLGFAGAGVLAVALYVVVRMLGGSGADLFFGGRLRDPLSYPNGQAGYFLVGLWPFVALAEWARKPLLAGVGMAGAFVIACVLLVGQTRGVLPGVAVSAAVLVLLVPGRGRRLWILIALGAGLAVVAQPLLDIYQADRLTDEIVEDAAPPILIGALVLGALWAAVTYAASLCGRAAEGRDPRLGRALPLIAAGAATAVVAVAAVGVLVQVDDPGGELRDQYDEFVNLDTSSDEGQSTRFFSGGGYRYDYWRISYREFRDEPFHGLGAGNYDTQYFLRRQTTEDIRQPHSIEMQTLAELGLVGGLALAAFVLAVLFALWGQSRKARADDDERLIAVAAGGAFVAWLAHTSVDWLHIIPGITAIALIAAAVLVSPWVVSAGGGWTPVRIGVTVLAGLAIVLGAQMVSKPTAGEFLRNSGNDALKTDPVKSLKRANEALSLQSDSVRALYLKSAAYARLGDYRRARAALVEATRVEPHDHLPWALLGDLAARRGDVRLARRDYTRAFRLNPQDFRLEQLAADPKIAAGQAGP
jgi:tetratricopeptide (TPR) repeat protein